MFKFLKSLFTPKVEKAEAWPFPMSKAEDKVTEAPYKIEAPAKAVETAPVKATPPKANKTKTTKPAQANPAQNKAKQQKKAVAPNQSSPKPKKPKKPKLLT